MKLKNSLTGNFDKALGIVKKRAEELQRWAMSFFLIQLVISDNGDKSNSIQFLTWMDKNVTDEDEQVLLYFSYFKELGAYSVESIIHNDEQVRDILLSEEIVEKFGTSLTLSHEDVLKVSEYIGQYFEEDEQEAEVVDDKSNVNGD